MEGYRIFQKVNRSLNRFRFRVRGLASCQQKGDLLLRVRRFVFLQLYIPESFLPSLLRDTARLLNGAAEMRSK